MGGLGDWYLYEISLWLSAGISKLLQYASAYVSIRRHTSAYVSIRQHTSAYVSIRQHTSACVSIRHTSAYVSMRQHTLEQGCSLIFFGLVIKTHERETVCVCVMDFIMTR